MKLLRIVGWILIPFVMVILAWKRMGRWAKAAAVLWTAITLLGFLGNISTGQQPSAKRPQVAFAVDPVTHRQSPRKINHPKGAPKQAPKPKAPVKTKTLSTLAQKAAIQAQNDAAILKTLESYPSMGQEVQAAGMDVSIANISTGPDGPWPGGVGLKSQFDVEISAVNETANVETLHDDQFALVETPGPGQRAALFMPDSKAEIATTGSYAFPSVTLYPGDDFEGWIIFATPSALTPHEIQMHYNLLMSSGFLGSTITDFSFLN